MNKKRLLLLAVLALVMSFACAMFAACGKDNTPKHAITWTVDQHATVKVEGYDELPAELAEGTEITFTVTFDTGYEVSSVSGGGVKASGNKYTFTVAARDVEIKVASQKVITSLDVTNTVEVYYAGNTVDPETVSVKVNYAVGNPETVTGEDCSYIYQSGSAFSLGDTKYSVRYRNYTEDVELDDAVVGLVKIDLAGGEITDAELIADWAGKDYTDYNYDTENNVITWTFDEAFEEEVVLPTEEQISKVINGNPFPFKNWSGVKDGKIAEGTAVSVYATAVYDPQLIDVQEIHITEVEISGKAVPALVVSGEWKAATEAYLYLYEGNDKITLIGPTVTKTAGSDDFELVFDITELITKTPKDFDEEASKNNFLGAWMDIKFRATLGDRVETQEINLINYAEDFVDLEETIEIKIEDNYYLAQFKVHTPDGTQDRNLKLDVEATTHNPFRVTLVDLEKDADTGVAYVVINGLYIDDDDEDTFNAAVDAVYADLQNNDGASHMGWEVLVGNDAKTVTKNYADKTFKIYLSLEDAEAGRYYFMHFTSSGTNLESKNISDTVITATSGETTLQYSLVVWTGWGSNLVNVVVEDPNAKKLTVDTVTITGESDKVYYVITGTSERYTQEELADLKLDFENAAGGSDKIVVDASKVTVTLNNDGSYTYKADITDLAEGVYWTHFAPGTHSGNGDVTNNSGVDAVTCGDKAYGIKQFSNYWNNYLIYVEAAE